MSSIQESYEVQVAVYDLSHGMARGLSAQFLGPQHTIEAIPHTGVIVYGMEYFFGGGIQCENPIDFRRTTGILPIQVLTVGRTHVNRTTFDAWCRQKMDSGEFSMASYDLLTHNCNTFSHAALTQGLQMSQGLPEWILDVPRKFLASPMGQIVRPMLDNMQLGQVSGAQTMSSTAPFASAAPPVTTAAPATNPWAQMPTPLKKSSSPLTNSSLEILSTHKKPLLANETKTVPMLVNSLMSLATEDGEAEDLRLLGNALEQQKEVSGDQVSRVATFLLRCLESCQKTTFALMFLRLMVLSNAKECQTCLQWILDALPQDSLHATASRAMSWLSLSNVAANAPAVLLESKLESLVELSVQDISPDAQSRVEVRQAAAAFIYNTVLTSKMQSGLNGSELSDLHVSILCACLDSLDLESDDTVLLRRILAAARILVPLAKTPDRANRHEATAQLIADLGFKDGLETFAQNQSPIKSAKLAKEVLSILMD